MSGNTPQQYSIEVDSRETGSSDDFDSIYSDDSASLTETLASSIKRFKFEHGRRYQSFKEDQWSQPNDEAQQDHMDLYHEIYTRAIGGKLYLAHLPPNPQRVLDLGTGTGIWAIQFADRFTSAAVTGNDLSPIQPTWVPPNCNFEVDDFNQDWTFTQESFDFVHARGCHAAVTSWPNFCKSAYRALKPGGWFEICSEVIELTSDDNTLLANSVLYEMINNTNKALEKIGTAPVHHSKLIELLKVTGFDEKSIEQHEFKLPVGTWPKRKADKELGGMNLVNVLMGLEGFILALYTRTLGFSVEYTKIHIEQLKREFRDKKKHMYFRLHHTYAQKPTSTSG